MKRFAVFLLLMLAAMAIAGVYGAVHDQISFSVSAEYFTRFKYVQFGLVDSALPDRVKAALIGFLASWWMGIPIGAFVGAYGFIHKTPKRMWSCSLKAFAVVAGVALAVGLMGLAYGWFFASPDPGDYYGRFVPEGLEYPRNYLAVGRMHNFSYLGGVIGLLVGIVAQFIQRARWRRLSAATNP